MPFIKLGELIEISRVENTDSCIPSVSQEILDNFKKFASNLKKIAPRAEDFLYFSAIMMHAAEAAALNDDGTNRLTVRGEQVQVGWDKGGGTWKWTSNDSNIKPYKNSNGDIFPEEELVKAYKKWVGKPLCIDHKSSSVDHVRGFIVDTYYDRNLKRVIALCALDKKGYPQLARQVSTGVSNCVSMGTAVGKAICSDCARVARTEHDFCDHMRKKSCYGEINIDLNPIELSIVVNGADPKANIKHIIAAANTMNNYLENRSNELSKLGSYSATLLQSDDGTNSILASKSVSVRGDDLESFKQDIERGIRELQSYSEISNQDTNNCAFNQSSGTIAMDETDVPNTDSGLAPPHARFASEDLDMDSISELRKVTAAIEEKISFMKISLDKLSNSFTQTQEENMPGSKEINKKGYYQGTEEPTPGQSKYTKDPLNEQLRENEDRQMVGQSPFPEVGPVDGMHPSPSSVDPSGELERKKMLARAQAEENAMKRNAIVSLAKQALENKKAYFNNGSDKNPGSPTPGQQKYPVDKLQYDLREDSDKHMVGQKPFPGVGSVDGMHPSPDSAETSDELKRKELLRRASLKAHFVKASNNDGTQNLAKSAWEIYLGDKLLLSASVNDLSRGKVSDLYSNIATRAYGVKLLENIKTFGADRVRAMVKSGQETPAAPPAAPAPAAPEAAPVDAMPAGGDVGATGDPKESAPELMEEVQATVEQLAEQTSDLKEAVSALTGESSEMGDVPQEGAPMAASAFSVAHMNSLRKELNSELTYAMKDAISKLADHQQELEMISGMQDTGAISDSNNDFVSSIIEDALTESKAALASGFGLMTAFVKYARGTQAIVKRAQVEAELNELVGDNGMDKHIGKEDDKHANNQSDNDAILALLTDDPELDELVGDKNALDLENVDGVEGLNNYDAELADDNDLQFEAGEMIPPGLAGKQLALKASFNSKAGRSALRAKLAANALGKEDNGELQDMSKAKFSDMLDAADSLADGQTDLDVKPSDNLGLVETLPEVNRRMMELAKAPPKVRKEAEAIHRLVSEGKLNPTDLDALVAEGLDKDAVSYYKKYFGQVDGGGEFASELVKEHVKAELEKELNTFKIKMARAYELTYDMVDRGLVAHDRQVIASHVDELMSFNEANFETLKKVIARHSPVMHKEAGRMPQVGMIGSGEMNGSASADDDWSQLSAAFGKTTKRMF
ncbi:hypothetical protein UFOVP1290_621 [uncultured Caudovirales phage]|uniref:Uncharacterized protein n=1 Tax=uncultured Caudovirales phage TaxID=2100421 RepID=A0A6J5RU67_9CAUD|nr:hypothetical protein UFOVP1290_621 [uncultured Caudovirales phage]